MDPLFRKAMRDLRGQTIWWGVGMAFLLGITVALFPSVSDIYSDIFEELGDEWAGFVGDGDFNTLEGYLSAEFFSFAQIALAVFAILAGGAAIVGEETQGTMDLLLAQPVSRLRVVLVKLGALVASITIILAITTLGFLIPVLFIDEVNAPGRIAVAFPLFLPFEVAVALTAALLAQLFGSRVVGGSILAGLLVASYMLDALSGVDATLESLRPVYLTSYYQGQQALNGDVNWAYVGVSLAAIVVLGVANVVLFLRRDIAVNGILRLPKLRLGGSS